MKKSLLLVSAATLALSAMAAPVAGTARNIVREDGSSLSAARKVRGAATRAEMKFDVSESDIIYDTPAGKSSLWSKACSYYSMSLFGIGEGSSDGMPCRIVEGDNGEMYIYNPFSAIDTKSWLKATISGDEMTINLPQAIYADSDGENDYVYVAQVCHFEVSDPETGEGLYHSEEGDTKVTFKKDGDSWVMQREEVNDHPLIIGLVAADDASWCAYSDWDITLSPFFGETVTPPADLKPAEWVMNIPVEGDYVAGKFVNVGFTDDDEVYMQGFSSMFPEAWIKGSLKDGKVTFPSRQYLGADEMNNTFGYFFGATEEEVYNEEWDFTYMEITLADNLVLDYNADQSTMTTEGTLVINKGDSELSIIDSFSAPKLRVQGDVTDFTPANPVPGYFTEPGEYAGSLYFSFPSINNEGQLLDVSNLYYRVYVDGELMTFYTDEYEGLEEDTEEIPFTFSNMNNLGYFGTGDVTHFFYFTFTGYRTIDIQTLYRDGENVYESKIVNAIGGDSGVAGIDIENALRTEWYDLSGRRVDNPGKGLWIKRAVMQDGTSVASKEMIR